MRLAAIIIGLAAAPVAALTPPLPCDGIHESDMMVYGVRPLGDREYNTGVVIEGYAVRQVLDGTTYVDGAAPVAELQGFHGARAVHCGTGAFWAMPGAFPEEAALMLAGTEFLRDAVRDGEMVTQRALGDAVRAIYRDAIQLSETAQTCACDAYYPELRPARQMPFADRTDVTN